MYSEFLITLAFCWVTPALASPILEQRALDPTTVLNHAISTTLQQRAVDPTTVLKQAIPTTLQQRAVEPTTVLKQDINPTTLQQRDIASSTGAPGSTPTNRALRSEASAL
ncbi:hypothetical protein LOZ57_004751 [Ophidiomyces ophidiicola]|uniref:uncharacterized protein n=1 Tax=Ophidiomyces ophidiicola TaxID=1387563 RepID=UPI0020C39B9E|nr:uncharacterized protein LOZ57_004751 [Ophidiomyces ophidiicola]KAI1944738.1 hypothetical protein LOZ57_004751 [Ophidiomyces ophidiicola]KAI2057888.1 hypothetical protein LOZ43_002919 [Ophidiomyces ophidiicola]